MLITETNVTLRITSGGRLPRWLGPPFKGLVGRGLPDALYRQLFDPEPSTEDLRREVPPVPVVISPCYPSPPLVKEGEALRLKLITVGVAADHNETLLGALRTGGERQGLHFDQQSVRFTVEPLLPDSLRICHLTPQTLLADVHSAKCLLPSARIDLTSPLRLKERYQSEQVSRAWVKSPSMTDFVMASVRIIRRLFQAQGERMAFDEPTLFSLADRMPSIENSFRPFRQQVLAHAKAQKHQFDGILGHGIYRDVPLPLIPWLQWGGRLHVGDRRAAGAGGWRMILE